MDDQRIGAAFRSVRRRLRWTQAELARRARASQAMISRIERGHVDTVTIATLRAVAAALDIRVDLQARWRAGDLDRLLSARHSELHELVARHFAAQLPAWVLAPEVSFSIYGERGVIDILAWHPGTKALLVIELKTDIADVNELIGTSDRKRRLAAQVARDRGWHSTSTSLWLIVLDDRTSRRRIDEHRTVLRAAFPHDGRAMRRWLRKPEGSIAAMSTWPGSGTSSAPMPRRRVRVRRAAAPD